MEEQKKLTLSELKVGIFVIVASLILAVAIFTIGSQVGLLEETFTAKTYLNNVSGLKPGDIVLLGGVEVGNVTKVYISEPDEMPPTQENQRKLEVIRMLGVQETELERTWNEGRLNLAQARADYETALNENGPNDPKVAELRTRLQRAENVAEDQLDDLEGVRKKIERARSGLQNIVLYLQIKSQYRDWIREDSNISLGSVGLLGDKYIEVSLGRSPDPPVTEVETVDGLFGADKRQVVLITGRPQTGFQELITGANDILTNFETLSETLQDIMVNFEEGKGSIGKFFNDPSFYNNLNDTVLGARDAVDNASRLLNDIARGEGTIPQLIQQRELYDKINSSVSRLESVAAKIDQGEGALGKAVNDPEVYNRANDVLGNLRGVTARLEAGEGTLGKLSKDDKLYQDLSRSLDQLAAVMADVEKGKGTLGRLAKDEQLYQNLNEVSSEVVKLIYDFRQNPKKFLTIKFELF